MRKYLSLFILCLLLFTSRVNAEECDAVSLKPYREMANGVEINYELLDYKDADGDVVRDMYKINISGLTEQLYIYNASTDKFYYYNNLDNILLSGGQYKIFIRDKKCKYILKRVVLKLPVYNLRYNNELCKKNSELDVCQEWVDKEVTDKEFQKALDKKKKEQEEKKVSFLQSNLKYFIIGFSAVTIILVILIVSKRKRGVLE